MLLPFKYTLSVVRRQRDLQVETAARKTSRSIVIEIQGSNALILNRSMVLLKYKLNNVCDADHRPASGAQRTIIVLIYHNIL